MSAFCERPEHLRNYEQIMEIHQKLKHQTNTQKQNDKHIIVKTHLERLIKKTQTIPIRVFFLKLYLKFKNQWKFNNPKF